MVQKEWGQFHNQVQRKKFDRSLGKKQQEQEAGRGTVLQSPEAGREGNVYVWAGYGGQALSSRNRSWAGKSIQAEKRKNIIEQGRWQKSEIKRQIARRVQWWKEVDICNTFVNFFLKAKLSGPICSILENSFPNLGDFLI